MGFDNAHPVGKQKRGDPQDHRHSIRTVKPYDYLDAATLLADFWTEVDAVLKRERIAFVTTLKVGIATYDEMKALTIAIARGQRKLEPHEPRVWFPSTESFAKVLSASNRELLRVIVEKAPRSLDELGLLTGRKKSNLSRTLKTMANYGFIRLERGPRGRITAKVDHDRIELDLPLVRKDNAA